MSPRPINVLLLLSSEQKPEPIKQIDILEQESTEDPDGITHFVTTRRCADSLTPGESTVAFFGDIGCDHKLLGRAVFLSWIEIKENTDEWSNILNNHPLYGHDNVPETAVVLIELKDVRRIVDGDIEDLNGVLDDGSKLTFDTVRKIAQSPHSRVFGTRISSLFYLDSRGGPPSTEEQISLLSAKREELEDKVWNYADRWRRSVTDRNKIDKELKDTTKKFAPVLDALEHGAAPAALAAISNEQQDDFLVAFQIAVAIILCDGDASLFEWLLNQSYEVLTSPVYLSVWPEMKSCKSNGYRLRSQTHSPHPRERNPRVSAAFLDSRVRGNDG